MVSCADAREREREKERCNEKKKRKKKLNEGDIKKISLFFSTI